MGMTMHTNRATRIISVPWLNPDLDCPSGIASPRNSIHAVAISIFHSQSTNGLVYSLCYFYKTRVDYENIIILEVFTLLENSILY